MHIINPLFISLIAFALSRCCCCFLWKICYNFCVGAQTINKLISLRFIARRSQMFFSLFADLSTKKLLFVYLFATCKEDKVCVSVCPCACKCPQQRTNERTNEERDNFIN